MGKIKATQRMHMWFEIEDGMFMGLGRIQLLERIDRYGSLNKAAASMGMSYRAAWGRMKKTEALLGKSLVDKTGPRKEFRLTELGREVVQKFREWQSDVEGYALGRAKKIFPWAIHPFDCDETSRKDKVKAPEED
ncbi:MAG: LysR family transcriptional regulator [Proteobacteria bacterium]|nr:LysR family transcriptional regulator [Pseudomonadota bacterium]